MKLILEKLKSCQNRNSTQMNYFKIWQNFNHFVMQLDIIPEQSEDRTSLFLAHLYEQGMQSASLKSYCSAIKNILVTDGYDWCDKKVLLSTIVKACRLVNDTVKICLPIRCGLLELMLFEFDRLYGHTQPYLKMMYMALFCLGYYGPMRVGELCKSNHVALAQNVHMAKNKEKLLVILYSSKTHDKSSRPQKIKITLNRKEKTGSYLHRNFFPFRIINQYIKARGNYNSPEEQFFVLGDKSLVTPVMARKLLRSLLNRLGLDSSLYDVHSLRIGRTSDLVRYGYPVEQIKRMGRRRSSAV